MPLRRLARVAPPATLARLDSVHGIKHYTRVMGIGRAQRDHKQDARGFDRKIVLRARFALLRQIGASFSRPL
jgi:hypothetical protein